MLGGFGLGKSLRSTIVNATAALFNDYTSIPLEKLRAYFNLGKGNQFDDVKKLEFVGEGSLTNGTLSNQNVEIPSANLKVGATQDFSLMFWFKSSSAGQNTTLVDCVDSSASSKGFKISLKSNGRITCSMKDDDGTTANDLDSGGSTTNDDGLWHHFAASFDRDGSRHFYIDGELDRSKGISGLDKTIDVDLPWHLMNNNQVTVGNNGFLGSMKNFAVWHRILTQDEIQNIRFKTYEELKSSETVHLKGWYPLESNANDSTGNQNATVTGGTNQTFNSSKYGLNNPTKPRGKDNDTKVTADQLSEGSILFDNTPEAKQHLALTGGLAPSYGDWKEPYSTNLTNEFTVMGWFIFDQFTYETIVGDVVGDGSSFSKDNFIQIINATTYRGEIEGNATGTITHGETLVAGQWHHLAWTRNSSNVVNLYIDGKKTANPPTVDGIFNFNGIGGVTNGSGSHEGGFSGRMANVSVWVGDLSHQQINEIKEKSYSELTNNDKSDEGTDLWDSSAVSRGQWESKPDNDMTITITGQEYAMENTDGDSYADLFLANTTSATSTLTTDMDANSMYKLEWEMKTADADEVSFNISGAGGDSYGLFGAKDKYPADLKYRKYTAYIFTDGSVSDTDHYLRVQSLGAGEKIFIKNISVKKVTYDLLSWWSMDKQHGIFADGSGLESGVTHDEHIYVPGTENEGNLSPGRRGSFSVSIWCNDSNSLTSGAYSDGHNSWGRLVGKGSPSLYYSGNGPGWTINRYGANRNRFSAAVGDGTNKVVMETGNLDPSDDSGMVHVVLVVDRSTPMTGTLYINGHPDEVLDMSSVTGSLNHATSDFEWIDRISTDRPRWWGMIHNCAYYSRALTHDEVLTLHVGGVFGDAKTLISTENLDAYWMFDEDNISGTTVPDLTGNGNDAVLENMTYRGGIVKDEHNTRHCLFKGDE